MNTIQLGDYHIYIGDIRAEFNRFLDRSAYSSHMILVDDHTETHCLPRMKGLLSGRDHQIMRIPSGERFKNIDTCQAIWRQMLECGADRNALMINLGGGVIGDMGGFCAASFKRGIPFVQIPTTLLSQVDASIGGKLGIDFLQVKNSIGLFKNPQGVFIDPAFLETLPPREMRSGLAEIIKHALIADRNQWESIRRIKNLDKVDWRRYITPSLLIKKAVVEADPLEKGLRKALNFGHTVGHAVEGFFLEKEGPLLHGEAIAIGMICESYLSNRLLGLPIQDMEDICRFLIDIFGCRRLNPEDYNSYIQLMRSDKKNEKNQISFSLIRSIGHAVVGKFCEESLIIESLDFYNRQACE